MRVTLIVSPCVFLASPGYYGGLARCLLFGILTRSESSTAEFATVTMATDKITFLTNWYANALQCCIFLLHEPS